MSNLQSRIQELATVFATGVLAAVRGSSLEELLGERGGSAAFAAPKRGPGRPRKVDGGTGTGNPAHAVVTPAKRGKGGRLARRSEADLHQVIGLVVGKLKEHKAGLRSEDLQKLLKLDKKEITRPLELALKAKKVTKQGQKRSTTYFAK